MARSTSKKRRSLARKRGRGRPRPVQLNEALVAAVEACSGEQEMLERVYADVCVHFALPSVGFTPMFTRDAFELAQWLFATPEILAQPVLAELDAEWCRTCLDDHGARPIEERVGVAWVRMASNGQVDILAPTTMAAMATIDHLADPLPPRIPVATVDLASLELRILVAAVRSEPVVEWLERSLVGIELTDPRALRAFVVAVFADAWLALEPERLDERVRVLESQPSVDALVAELDHRPDYVRTWDDERGDGSWARAGASIVRDATGALSAQTGQSLLLELVRADRVSDLAAVRDAISGATPESVAEHFAVDDLCDALGFELVGRVRYCEDDRFATIPVAIMDLPSGHPLLDLGDRFTAAQGIARRDTLPTVHRASFDEAWQRVRDHARWIDLVRFVTRHPVPWVDGAGLYEFIRLGAIELAHLGDEPLPSPLLGAGELSLGETFASLPPAIVLREKGATDDVLRTLATSFVAGFEAAER